MNPSIECVYHEPQQPAVGSVIWLHGLGADGHDFSGIVPQLQLEPELPLRFIFPHAPIRPITINNQMPMRGWYDIYSLDRLDREDETGVKESQAHIEQLIANEKSQGIPSNKIILAGFSQGGAIALYAGLRHAEPLAGILALSTYLPLHQHIESQHHSANANTHIFQAHGTQDEVLPIQLAELTYQVLKNADFDIHWHPYPMGHQVCIEEIQAISSWIKSRFT